VTTLTDGWICGSCECWCLGRRNVLGFLSGDDGRWLRKLIVLRAVMRHWMEGVV